jgi:hypothetical protein
MEYELLAAENHDQPNPAVAESGGGQGDRGFANPVFSIDTDDDDDLESNDLEKMSPVPASPAVSASPDSLVLPSVPATPSDLRNISPVPASPAVHASPDSLVLPSVPATPNTIPRPVSIAVAQCSTPIHDQLPPASEQDLEETDLYGPPQHSMQDGPPQLSMQDLDAEPHKTVQGGPPLMSLGDPLFDDESTIIAVDNSETEPMKLVLRGREVPRV